MYVCVGYIQAKQTIHRKEWRKNTILLQTVVRQRVLKCHIPILKSQLGYNET